MQVMQQPPSVASHLHSQQPRFTLQICFPSRTQQQQQSPSQISSYRLIRLSHFSDSSQEQRMQKPPRHFSNESRHDTASRMSIFVGESFGADFPLHFVITLLAIGRSPSVRVPGIVY